MKQAGGKIADLTFSQKQEVLNNDYDLKNGNNPYYQWGRKDPMLPGNGISDTDKTCFTTDAQYRFAYKDHGEPLNTNEIKEYIRNPHKFNINSYMDGQYLNLWSTDNDKTDANDDVVIKTVYDPSPVGYSLPASNAFTGFTTTGQNIGNPNQSPTPEQRAKFNVKGNWDKGWYFYTKLNKTGNILWFSASGYRGYSSGYLFEVPLSGAYGVAGPVSQDRGRCLCFASSYIYQLYVNGNRSDGLAVRSAEEKVLKYELDEIAKGV